VFCPVNRALILTKVIVKCGAVWENIPYRKLSALCGVNVYVEHYCWGILTLISHARTWKTVILFALLKRQYTLTCFREICRCTQIQPHKKYYTNPSCTTADHLCQENVISETASKCDDSTLLFLRVQHLKPMMVRAGCEVTLFFWISFSFLLNESAQSALKWRYHPKKGKAEQQIKK